MRKKFLMPLIIDLDLIAEQIDDVLESNLNEKSKNGLHNFLGTIRDCAEKGEDCEDLKKALGIGA